MKILVSKITEIHRSPVWVWRQLHTGPITDSVENNILIGYNVQYQIILDKNIQEYEAALNALNNFNITSLEMAIAQPTILQKSDIISDQTTSILNWAVVYMSDTIIDKRYTIYSWEDAKQSL